MTANQVNGQKVPSAMPIIGPWQPVVAPQNDKAEADRAAAEAMLAKANQLYAKAKEDAERTRTQAQRELDRARTEAQRIRDEAAAANDQRTKRDAGLDTWAARAVIAGTVGLTASGEYSLARLVHFDPAVAWLLPFVIDMYVIQAFRRHRDIPAAIGLTIAANVIYHLAAARGFGLTAAGTPEWWLVAIVASVASVILWRIHRMIAPPRERKQKPRESAPQPARETTVVAVDESPVVTLAVSRESSHPVPVETVRESALETSRPAALTAAVPQAKPRETRRHAKATKKVSPASDIERETAALVALMKERGGADAVSLKDAERITGKATATAARRLSAARAKYSQTPTR